MLNTGQTVVKAVADKLGVTVVDLQTQLKAGQTLSDIAKAKGVSDQDLRTAAVNALQPQLDAAVTAGKLTQQQEDSILQRIQQGQWPMLLGERMGGHQTRPQAPNPPQS
jgi:3-hydroxyacyl-CoA dehydrogenase